MPATNAVSERSFSALRRLKTWLRTTTTQSRLMLLHTHKEKTDALQMISVGNEFISRNVRLFEFSNVLGVSVNVSTNPS